MGLEIKKQERETSQGLIRRFTKSVQKSGILVRARNIQFRKRKKSRQAQQRAALRKEDKKREYDKLKKMGKIEA